MTKFKVFRPFVPTMFLSVFLLTGCGDSDKEVKSPLQDFSDRFAQIICGAYVDCGCMPESKLADCEASIRDIFPMIGGVALVAVPGMVFDNAAGQTCLDDLATILATCPIMYDMGPLDLPSSCGTVTSSGPQFSFAYGAQVEGAYCSIDQECVAGLGCDVLLGTCEPVVPVGGDCQYQMVRCASGSYCHPVSRTCVAYLNVGADCSGSGDECNENNGLFCEDDGISQTCITLHAIGEDCTYGPCVSGAYCDASYQCVAKKAGGTACTMTNCDSGDECLSGDHWSNASDYYCTAATFCNTFSFIRIYGS